MSKPKFDEYLQGGYWQYRDCKYAAIIKVSFEGWYGGAQEIGETSVPLHGPYHFKRNAKKKALAQLALIREEET